MRTFFHWPKVVLVCCVLTGSFVHFDVSAAEMRVGLVLDKGGKDDKSFNSAAYQGAMKVKNDLKSFVKYVEATDDNAFEPLLRSFAQKNFDLVIAVGVSRSML